MNKKKIIMIILLLIFLSGIGILVFIINNDASSKIDKETQFVSNTKNENITDVSNIKIYTDENNVRRIAEKITINTNKIIKITDNFFIEQTNDLYYNTNDYIGKAIKIEGFMYSYDADNGEICHAVIRNTPGCCGSDGLAGVDIRYNGDYLKDNTWVEVTGIMSTDMILGTKSPVILVSEIKEKEVGKSFVTN